VILVAFERPLSGKADIQELAAPKSIWNGRFAPGSGPSGNIAGKGRCRPIADISVIVSLVYPYGNKMQ